MVATAERIAPQVSGRVLLSVREPLHNRKGSDGDRRVFVNRLGRAWVTAETRPPVPDSERKRLVSSLDTEMRSRLPEPGHLLIDPDVLDVALPLSGRATAAGLGVLPRAARSPRSTANCCASSWKQTARSTDYDLSALILNSSYDTVSWLSYTALTEVEGEHSGDITDAPDGACEFINLRLGAARCTAVG